MNALDYPIIAKGRYSLHLVFGFTTFDVCA